MPKNLPPLSLRLLFSSREEEAPYGRHEAASRRRKEKVKCKIKHSVTAQRKSNKKKKLGKVSELFPFKRSRLSSGTIKHSLRRRNRQHAGRNKKTASVCCGESRTSETVAESDARLRGHLVHLRAMQHLRPHGSRMPPSWIDADSTFYFFFVCLF